MTILKMMTITLMTMTNNIDDADGGVSDEGQLQSVSTPPLLNTPAIVPAPTTRQYNSVVLYLQMLYNISVQYCFALAILFWTCNTALHL